VARVDSVIHDPDRYTLSTRPQIPSAQHISINPGRSAGLTDVIQMPLRR
jgi:hypothetical protein